MTTFRLVWAGGEVTNRRLVEADVISLAPEKGAWLREIDAPPSYDPAWQVCTGPTWAVNDDAGTVTASYVVEARPADDVKAERLAALATYRYQRETGGLTVGGMRIATDDRSKSLIVGAYTAASAGVVTDFKWKTESGFVTLNVEQVIGAGEAVAAFVQACFAAEATHAAAIDALETSQAVAEYDFTTGWPE